MKKHLLTLIGISTLALTGFLFPFHPQDTFAVTDHIVISEVQIGGPNGANDEFIELYNPTNSSLDLSDWSIQVQTITGVFSKKNFTNPAIIPSHGFYLITHSGYSGDIEADLSHGSFTLSSTGTTIYLVNNQLTLNTGNENTIVDKIAIGSSALNPETISFNSIPTNGTSVEQKANSISTSVTMGIGGSDEYLGNGEDTNNNSVDFVLRSIPQPQNSASDIEPLIEPTSSPSPEPTAKPSPEPSPEPTEEPSPTVTPTNEPTPTVSPIPTLEPTPTVLPTASPTLTRGPKIFSRNPIMTCAVNFKTLSVFGRTFYFPAISCFRTR